MIAVEEMADHELVAVDHRGEVCSCGVTDPCWLEHLADVAVELIGATRYPADREYRRPRQSQGVAAA